MSTEKHANTARENGKLGGRPRLGPDEKRQPLYLVLPQLAVLQLRAAADYETTLRTRKTSVSAVAARYVSEGLGIVEQLKLSIPFQTPPALPAPPKRVSKTGPPVGRDPYAPLAKVRNVEVRVPPSELELLRERGGLAFGDRVRPAPENALGARLVLDGLEREIETVPP